MAENSLLCKQCKLKPQKLTRAQFEMAINSSEFKPLVTVPADLTQGDSKSGVANLVSTILGAGILVLPLVMLQCGVIVGVFFLITLAAVNTFSLQLLCDIGRHLRKTDSSFQNRIIAYPIVGGIAYPRWGKQVSQVIVLLYTYMGIIGYFSACADIMPDIINYFRSPESQDDFFGNREFGALVTIVIVFPLCLIKRITKLWSCAVLAFIAECLLIFAIVFRSAEVLLSNEYPDNVPEDAGEVVLANASLQIFSAIAVITFSFTCHTTLLPIFSELQPKLSQSPEKTLRMIVVAISIACFMYCFAGVFGYLHFRALTPGNILTAYDTDDALMLIGRIGLILMLYVSVAIVHFASRRSLVVMIWDDPNVSSTKSAICTAFIIGSTFLLSLVFRQIGQIWSLAGAFCGSLISFVLPAIFWLKIVRGNNFFVDRKATCVTLLIPMGIAFLVLGTEEAIVDFIRNPPQF